MDTSFLAKQMLHDDLAPDAVHGVGRHTVPADVVKSMQLGGTVDQLHIINRDIHTVAKRKGRKHQSLHRVGTVVWVLLGLGVVAAVVISIVLTLLRPAPTCTSDSDCGPESRCLRMKGKSGTQSKTGTCTPAFACSTSSDCTGGRQCLAGFCQPATCASSADCLQGGALLGAAVYCDPASHTCQPGCDADSQCSRGLCNTTLHTCVEGACLPATGADADTSSCATRAHCGKAPHHADVRATLAYNLCSQATTCVQVSGHNLGECKVPCDPSSNLCDKLGLVCDGAYCQPITCTGTGKGQCLDHQVCTAAYAQGSAECATIWPVSAAGEGVCVSVCDMPSECGTPPSACTTVATLTAARS